MGMQRDGVVGTGDPERDAAVIGYFGDGATSQGDVNEAFIFASSYNAPVVFFCQNNQWAISEPIERQTRIPLYQRASGFGFPGVRVDGNDVLASHAVTTGGAGAGARRQGPDADRGLHLPDGRAHHVRRPDAYRLADEVEHWKLKDPIERVKAYLTRKRQWRRGLLRRRRGRGVRSSCCTCASAAWPCRTPATRSVRPRLRRADPDLVAQKAEHADTWPPSRT